MEIRSVGEVGEEGYQPTNVEWIPCTRTSFLTGISTGLGAGLLNFLFTSDVSRSYRLSLKVYLAVTLGKYFHCRWRLSTMKFESRKLYHAMTVMQAKRGTDEDPAIQKGEDANKSEDTLDVAN